MLPKQVTISAFGPYRDAVTICFDDFMQTGLFLITGPTGSGKTMIFDAIMFALYGESSGSDRQVSQLRCDQAEKTTKTYVELSFMLHEQEFHIYRSPSYFVPNKKTPRLANAILTLPDGKMIEGVKEVNQKIISLLGVDAKQYKQIVMIAQGEFTKLIYASSEEREKVLRNLFHTQKYRNLEEQLKETTKVYQEQYDMLYQQRTLQFQKLHLEDETIDMYQVLKEKELQVQQLKTNAVRCQKEYQEKNQELQYIKANNTRIQSLETITKEIHVLKQQEQQYQKLKEDIVRMKEVQLVLPLYEKKEVLQSQIKEIQKEQTKSHQILESLNEKYQALQQQNSLLPNKKIAKKQLEEQYQTMLHTKEMYLSWLDDEKELQVINQVLQVLTSKIEQMEKQKQEIEKKLEKDLQSISMIEKLKQEFLMKEKEYETLHQRKTEIHALHSLYNRSIQEEETRFTLEEKYKEVEKEYDVIKRTFEQKERQYQYEQAGMLATTLQDNVPCPVCGSLDHPRPAHLHTDTFDHQEYTRIKEEMGILQERQNEAYQLVLLKKQELDLLQKEMQQKKAELKITKELSKEVFIMELGTLQKDEKKMKVSYQNTKHEIQYLEKLKKTVEHNQKDVQSWQVTIEELKLEKQKEVTKKDQMNGKISTYTIPIEMSLEQLESTMLKVQQEIRDITLEMEKIETSYREVKEEKVRKESTNQSLYQQLSKIEEKQLQAMQEFQDALHVHSLVLEDVLEVMASITYLEEYERKYQEYQSQIHSLKKQQELLKKEVGSYERVDSTALEIQIKELEKIVQESEKQVMESKMEVLNYQQLITDITQLDQKLEKIEKKYQQYLHLTNITAGKNKYRVSLERYVLAAYFEQVLVYANAILMKMSQGRYQLYRRDNRSKGNAKQGLELDVLDLESGMLRDVKTLSGGESFKAALSLALGMSQMIQSYVGGIELQTLFIDEGFGTLDSQSLDQAINCLLELQQDNKLIGIISHVSELKERIENKIVVTRSYHESKIRLETN